MGDAAENRAISVRAKERIDQYSEALLRLGVSTEAVEMLVESAGLRTSAAFWFEDRQDLVYAIELNEVAGISAEAAVTEEFEQVLG